MQTIRTKYLGWTNTRPTRIKATSTGGHTLTRCLSTIPVQDPPVPGTSTDEDNHAYVASLLADQLGWFTATNYMIGGATHNGCYVFVLSDSQIIASKPGKEPS